MIGLLRRICERRPTNDDAAIHAELKAIHERLVIDTALDQLNAATNTLAEVRRRWYTQAPAPCEELARGAITMAGIAAQEMGVPTPMIVWFKPETERERVYRERWGVHETAAFSYVLEEGYTQLLGFCRPNASPPTIGVAVGQVSVKTLLTVAHEVAHLGANSTELAARRYERSWLHRLPQIHPEWVAGYDAWLAREIVQHEQQETSDV